MNKKELFNKIENEIEEYKTDIKFENFSEKDNEATIFINLKNTAIYKEYSNQTLLNDSIYEFLEETFLLVRKKIFLNIKIEFDENTNEDEKEKIIKLLKTHYAIKYKETKASFKRTNTIASILLLFGALLFALYILLEHFNKNIILCSIVEIFSWVFIWESCQNFFFTNAENRLESFRYMRLFSANYIK